MTLPKTTSQASEPASHKGLKLFVSMPFRARGDARLFPGAAFGCGDAAKQAYVDALVMEIETAAEGMDELLVDEIEFGGGPASSLSGAQLARIMRTIRQNYRLAPDACIHLSDIPGGITVDYAGFCKNAGVAWIELEVLTTNVTALKTMGLPPSLEPTVNCFQVAYFTGAPAMGILLDSSLSPNLCEFRRSVIESLARSPLYVRIIHSNDEHQAALAELCTARGMRRLSGDLWAREEFVGFPDAAESQLGFGLGAESRFDGILFKTTYDLPLYCAHSRDFGTIARQVV